MPNLYLEFALYALMLTSPGGTSGTPIYVIVVVPVTNASVAGIL